MPRRRLHGETQKRRKKKVTRDLKRKESIVRSKVTHTPAPFERSPQVGREDLEFLEAMRELDVRRIPGRMDSPLRRETVSRVQFQVEEEEKDGFAAHMEHMGVRPLEDRSGARRPTKGQSPPRAKPEAAQWEQAPESPRHAGPSSSEPVPEYPEAAASPPKAATTAPMRERQESPRGGSGFTTFVEDSGCAESMATLLEEAGFDPGEKFQGAPRTADSREGSARLRATTIHHAEHLEPDDSLDLHGKTQEEAIAMVQNFLLTCHQRRLHHVLIITGRGLNSGTGGPVLKEAVQRWLERNASRFARGFFPAPGRHGGAGAIWIVLR